MRPIAQPISFEQLGQVEHRDERSDAAGEGEDRPQNRLVGARPLEDPVDVQERDDAHPALVAHLHEDLPRRHELDRRNEERQQQAAAQRRPVFPFMAVLSTVQGRVERIGVAVAAVGSSRFGRAQARFGSLGSVASASEEEARADTRAAM
jgi:hypothetical protein